MKKKLKRRKKYHLNYIIYIFIFSLFGYLLFNVISNIKLSSSNDNLITSFLIDTNSYIEHNNNYKTSILDKIYYLEEPFRKVEEKEKYHFVFEEKELPQVYIYSTHDEEGFLSDYKEGYDLSPNIIAASYLLQDELIKRGVPTIVEENRVSEYKKAHNLKSYDSYKVTRNYVINALDKYPDLKLIIDLHRDALTRDNTYITYNNENYAKVLFVVGQKYDTYKQNLALSEKISEAIKKQIPKLSKGMMMKNQKEQNGVYNQDLNPNIILLELGSNNNTVDEVYNSIQIVANAIKEVLDG